MLASTARFLRRRGQTHPEGAENSSRARWVRLFGREDEAGRPAGAVKPEAMSHLVGGQALPGCSGGVAVLVDEPAAGRVPSDRFNLSDRFDLEAVGRCSLVQASVGSMCVVARDVLLEK
jgi:hypothetical protein